MSWGAVIIKNTTLKADVGPCPGDGIIIGADNITLDLSGHQILGMGADDSAGIRVRDHSGVTIRGGATSGPKPGRSAMGTVTGFGAGVASIGGSHNTVSGVERAVPAGNGIGVQSLIQTPPETDMLVEGNAVHDNARNGIDVQSRQNTIRGNNAANNVANASYFGGFDLRDANSNCSSNVWLGNIWGTGGFGPACTATGGHEQSTEFSAESAGQRPSR